MPPLPTTTVHSSPRGLILACINKLANSPYKRADSIAIRDSIKTDCPSPSNPICDQYAEHTEHGSGHTSHVCPDLTLPHSLARTSTAGNVTYRREAILAHCTRAQGTTRRRQDECAADAADANLQRLQHTALYWMGVEAAAPLAAAP